MLTADFRSGLGPVSPARFYILQSWVLYIYTCEVAFHCLTSLWLFHLETDSTASRYTFIHDPHVIASSFPGEPETASPSVAHETGHGVGSHELRMERRISESSHSAGLKSTGA